MGMFRKISFIFIPVLLAGFILPDDSCRQSKPADMQTDGPYILYRNNQVFIRSIWESNGARSVKTDSMPLDQREKITVQVATDDPSKILSFPLQKELDNQKTEFHQPEKLFVISDIEGNFTAFRKLLQAGMVIDSNFNWIFGKGHLVLTGDFVDRGSQVTEVLWLIYSLEDKAKAAGGYVHYILGNHEIMNLSGDLRYVQPKYIENAGLMKEGFTTLIGENSELGRWLRTRNIVEKIGDMLFTHGGISAFVNRMDISLEKINKLARPYYADSLYAYTDKRLDTIYGDTGPFWYRGYYQADKNTEVKTIDSTLDRYRIKHIATGHTILKDTISVLYNGKVFNTDVHHLKGHSEALLIENGKFYRVNSKGEKFLFHG